MAAETKPQLAKIGMIGLAVMGENLALNIARNGFPIAVFNRDSGEGRQIPAVAPKANRSSAPIRSRTSSTRSRGRAR